MGSAVVARDGASVEAILNRVPGVTVVTGDGRRHRRGNLTGGMSAAAIRARPSYVALAAMARRPVEDSQLKAAQDDLVETKAQLRLTIDRVNDFEALTGRVAEAERGLDRAEQAHGNAQHALALARIEYNTARAAATQAEQHHLITAAGAGTAHCAVDPADLANRIAALKQRRGR